MKTKILVLLAAIVSVCFMPPSAFAFEGRIGAVITQGGQTDALLYTVGTNFLRVEMTATNWPNPVDILDRQAGALTLLFPHNRSFVRLKPVVDNSSASPGFPQMPGRVPPVAGSQPQPPGAPAMPSSLPPGVGPQARPPAMPAMPNMPAGGGMPAMPAMPMPMMPGMMEKMELQVTGQKTNLLGFACQQYQVKQRGETLEIWATDQLLPYQPYVQNQPHRFGPRRIEEQWPELVKARKLFPLLSVLRSDHGPERFRFEVQSVTPQKLTDDDAKLFQPPAGWMEIQPLPF